MTSNQEMVKYLVSLGVLETPSIIKSFEQIDRINFIRQGDEVYAYEDHPLDIGYGATISQPYTVAFMLEQLQPKEGEKILDVGTGSGWTTALLAQIVGERGKIFGVELVPELVKFGNENLKKHKFPNAKITQAKKEIIGAPLALSGVEGFDRILVSAAASELPKELINQLKVGGRLVIPIQRAVFKIDKISESEIKTESFEGFAFVPLR